MKKGLSTDALQLVDWELSRGSVHLRGVSELFVAQLDEQELAFSRTLRTVSQSTARLAKGNIGDPRRA